MHFSFIVVLAVLAANVSAAPVNPLFIRAGTCDILPCVTALQPSFPACAPAVTAKGANTPSNTACLTAAAKGTAAFPDSCVACAPQFGVTDPANRSKKVPRTPQKNAQRAAAGKANNAQAAADTTAKNAQTGAGATPNTVQPAPAPAPNDAQAAAAAPAPNNANGAVPPPVPAKNTKKPAGTTAPCTISLEPSFPVCAPAVGKLGADDTLNLACLAAAAKGAAAFPSACDGCAAQFGVTDPSAATAAGHA
ncbi:hypothetical protein FB451DRAFT_1418283 [Mycena latifolia]|nr:hypothetical protein FB451DRAFT_1418283 [Mycena latifolia]